MPAIPLATYRIQFRPEFTLEDAAGLVPYLAELGVSHLYASPVFQAAPGSTHGYDVVDASQVNSELGGQAAFERLTALLVAQPVPLGLVLDIVPNHMAIHPTNPWWEDVLRNGPSSPFASYFDVEWNPPEARHSNAVLIPVLGDQYGRVLEAGEIQLAFDGDTFTVHYFDNVFPVDPSSLGSFLTAASERITGDLGAAYELAFLSGAFAHLPDSGAVDLASARRRYRDAEVLRGMLGRLVRERPEAGQAIQEVLAQANADADRLDAFLSRQNYRLAMWKISARELGYRRFFDINTMIGLRMEDEEVFRDTHALALSLVRRGLVDGLRIDHPDGLRDPFQYMKRLRAAAPESWIVIEKILEPGERLPDDWPVQGTTGYDFLNRVNGVLVDPSGEQPLSEFYTSFTGQKEDYAALVHEKKLLAANEVLGSDLARLTELFLQVCERHRAYRDYTRSELHRALAEMAACLPVYRTYLEPWSTSETAEGSPADRVYLDQASERARANRPELDPRLFEFLRDVLAGDLRGPVEEELAARFQQFTGPVMAKGVEDTTFYIYNRFVSLNEVGGDPGQFGISPRDFHLACQETQQRWPLTMLATSTHDTKRGEDVRARLNVLSEKPGRWIETVQRWAEMNEPHRTGEDPQRLPDRNTEYLLYQSLVGAWPITADRAVEYMRKAGREAKVYTSWTAPSSEYEEAVEHFVRAIFDDTRFTADLETFVAEILEAGRINALAQALLKLTTPGVPDIFQGSELWNLSLVDPDNRRPVDYSLRRRLLDGLRDDTPPEQVWEGLEDGLPKLWITRQALALRRAHPDWFGPRGSYTPLVIETAARSGEPLAANGNATSLGRTGSSMGEPPSSAQGSAAGDARRKDRMAVEQGEESLVAVTRPAASKVTESEEPGIAFLRGDSVLVAVPRLVTRFCEHWGEYHLALPPGEWRSLLTHETFQGGQMVPLAKLWSRFPAALLVRE